jgi:hypothetical protein
MIDATARSLSPATSVPLEMQMNKFRKIGAMSHVRVELPRHDVLLRDTWGE